MKALSSSVYAAFAGALLCGFAVPVHADEPPRDRLDPVGIWNCLVYAPFGDERIFLRLASDRSAYMARIRDASRREWTGLSNWNVTRGRIGFGDPDSGRDYSGELRQSTLGGTWRMQLFTGGWWCSRAVGDDADDERARPPSPAGLMPALVPAIMASPKYPPQAIRDAKEGRAVSCFFVNGKGEISNPALVELSDEIFGPPTLTAIAESRFRGWHDDEVVRPACRSFTFELDFIR